MRWMRGGVQTAAAIADGSTGDGTTNSSSGDCANRGGVCQTSRRWLYGVSGQRWFARPQIGSRVKGKRGRGGKMVARCPVEPTLLFSRWRVLPTPPCRPLWIESDAGLLNFGCGPSVSAPMGWGRRRVADFWVWCRHQLGALVDPVPFNCHLATSGQRRSTPPAIMHAQHRQS
jgi:hypothetical protein